MSTKKAPKKIKKITKRPARRRTKPTPPQEGDPEILRAAGMERDLEELGNLGRLTDRIRQETLEEDFERRVKDALVYTLLDAANRAAKQNLETVTAYLLAGCEQADVPSSSRIMNGVVSRLRELAAEQVDHPIPH